MTKIVLLAIRLYKLCLSPYIPMSCRFYPTCSCYMAEALKKRGSGREQPWASSGSSSATPSIREASTR